MKTLERKYLIEFPDLDFLRGLPDCKEFKIIQIYLESDDDQEIIMQKKIFNGSCSFTKIIKRQTLNLDSTTIEKTEYSSISRDEYNISLIDMRVGFSPIFKTRFCLCDDAGHYFKIDIYPNSEQYAILEIEFKNSEEQFKIPPFIKVIKEVTGDKRFRDKEISKNGNNF